MVSGQEKVDLLIEQYKQYHKEQKGYGPGSARRNLPVIRAFARRDVETVLDYGCGKGKLVEALNFDYKAKGYDPAIPQYQFMPAGRFDLVVCFDVMEHLCHHNVDGVIREIGGLAKKQVIFSICCRPAAAILPNGWNAHTLLLEPHQWYRKIATNLTLWNLVETRLKNKQFYAFLEHKRARRKDRKDG